MLRCKSKSFDQFKDCLKEHRSLFELEPMKFETTSSAALSTDSSVSHTKTAGKAMSSQSILIFDKSSPTMVYNTKSSINSITSKDQSTHLTKSKDTAIATGKVDSKRIHCTAHKTISNTFQSKIPKLSTTSWRATANAQSLQNNVSKEYDLNNVKKRKRQEDILDNSTQFSHSVLKRAKVECSYVEKQTISRIPKRVPLPPMTNQKIRKKLSISRNKELLRSIPTKPIDQINSSHKSKQSLIPSVKSKSDCKWIECKVNHPIKQSKSKIPLLIHQLGSKNEANLIAHMKRIGAYKNTHLPKTFANSLKRSSATK